MLGALGAIKVIGHEASSIAQVGEGGVHRLAPRVRSGQCLSRTTPSCLGRGRPKATATDGRLQGLPPNRQDPPPPPRLAFEAAPPTALGGSRYSEPASQRLARNVLRGAGSLRELLTAPLLKVDPGASIAIGERKDPLPRHPAQFTCPLLRSVNCVRVCWGLQLSEPNPVLAVKRS